ncbi:MAG: hypothetical protein KAH22_08075 [Thiotrichaceae bacterium]|nr:hypothetical protein [Thiotrichaceae bacterium]
MRKFKFIANALIFIIMIGIGVVATMVVNKAKSKKNLAHDIKSEPVKVVDVMTVTKQAFSATVIAYGNVEPAVVLQGKAEVSGKVSYIHPKLKEGGSISKGTVVIRINSDDYNVSLQQTKADLVATRAQLTQIQQEKRSTQSALKLANNKLKFGFEELERIRSLWKRRLIAHSVLDAEEQKVIQLQQGVQDIEGKLSTYSSRFRSANANIRRSQQQVKGKENTLGRTIVRMPFDARISSVSVEKGQFTAVGGALFEAINTDGVEIKAEIPLHQMKSLLSPLYGKSISLSATSFNHLVDSLHLKAQVTLVDGEKTTWKARVVRFAESIDPLRRTLGIIVAVDDPYGKVVIGQRLPLLKGMYVAVKLTAPSYKAIVIPRSAVHLGRVYVIDNKQRLAIHDLKIQSRQGSQVIVSKGLKVGDTLIVNDLIPVIVGMRLKASEQGQP